MTTLFSTSIKTTTKPPWNITTKPYQNFLNYIGLPEPLFFAIIIAGLILVLLILFICITKVCCKSCCWKRKVKSDKKKLSKYQDINALLQNELNDAHGFGRIDFLLGYKIDAQILFVKVVQVSDLPPPIDGSLDPYVIISVNSKSNNEEKKTKIKMATETPVFNQKFQFKIFKSEFQDSTIKFKVLDFDKFGADALLGQLTLNIKDLDRSAICNGNVEFSMNLEEGEDTCEGMGQICIILDHTKIGLTITILEAKNIRIKEKSNYALMYVKIMYQTQKASLKFKTRLVRETQKISISKFPYFNETFVFHNCNVPLNNCRVKFKLYMSGRFRVATCIGYLILGSESLSQSGELHWNNMLDNPRHPIARWHLLTNPNIRE